jgi:hypothetical protein
MMNVLEGQDVYYGVIKGRERGLTKNEVKIPILFLGSLLRDVYMFIIYTVILQGGEGYRSI